MITVRSIAYNLFIYAIQKSELKNNKMKDEYMRYCEDI